MSEEASLEIELLRAGDIQKVMDASVLFDGPAHEDWAEDFLGRDGHHLLVAYLGNQPVGFVTGVEIAHPDKGVEMLVYELAVEEAYRRLGIAKHLLGALDHVGVARGCRSIWVVTEPDNEAAIATYRSMGGTLEETVLFEWAPSS